MCDDKSGYDHILLTVPSRTFFGFEWAGWYFVSNSIPFGWKSSAYIYHTTGLLASHYFRSLTIPCSLYIDDRHNGQLLSATQSHCYSSLPSLEDQSRAAALSASFIVCYTLISLGYYLSLEKSILLPRQEVPYLGFLVNSVKQSFLLLDKKKQKFIDLVRYILTLSSIDLKTLQRLAGKCSSFALAVPAARLFTNEINLAIAKATRSSRPVALTGPLKSEIDSWLFLDTWQGFLPWRSEVHRHLILCCDASNFAWGAVFNPVSSPLTIRDYWPPAVASMDINTKELLALCNALDSVSPYIKNSWVDVYTDSQVLIASWQRQCARSHSLIASLKRLFFLLSESNIHLSLSYLPSKSNLADGPSRKISLLDSQLAPASWTVVQQLFGGDSGHSVDLMALPSNVQSFPSGGGPLPFFSPFPVPGAAGVNVFAQDPARNPSLFRNPYAFPPIILIPDLLRFLKFMNITCTLVIPDVHPRRFWWPILQQYPSVLLAKKGSKGVVLTPSPSGFSPNWPLPWDLFLFRKNMVPNKFAL